MWGLGVGALSALAEVEVLLVWSLSTRPSWAAHFNLNVYVWEYGGGKVRGRGGVGWVS